MAAQAGENGAKLTSTEQCFPCAKRVRFIFLICVLLFQLLYVACRPKECSRRASTRTTPDSIMSAITPGSSVTRTPSYIQAICAAIVGPQECGAARHPSVTGVSQKHFLHIYNQLPRHWQRSHSYEMCTHLTVMMTTTLLTW